MAQKPPITVIGSANIDIHGSPSDVYVPEDSNPGTVRLSIGGVGCNIARNLSALGWNVRFITALGDDILSARVKQELENYQLDYSRALFLPGGKTSCYLYVTDERGSTVSAVSDMEITKALTPQALSQRLDLLNEGCPVVFDANLSEEAIGFLVENVHVPLAADGVSAAKAPRLAHALPHLDILKCNRMEAGELTGTQDIHDAAQTLVAAGVRQVFITLGERGVCCADRTDVRIVAGTRAAHVLNTTGAGDSFLAGAVHTHYHGANIEQSARFAVAAAALTCQSSEAVHPALNEETILQLIQR